MAVFAGARHYKGDDVQHRLGAYNWDHDDHHDTDSEDGHRHGHKFVHFTARQIEAKGGEIADALSACSDETDLSDLPLRARVHLLLTDPGSSTAALYVSVWFFLLIVLSTLAFILETLPVLSPDPEYGDPSRGDFWFGLETFFVAFFTFEYVAALVTAREPLKYPFGLFQVIDLVAILPYYIELLVKYFGGGGMSSNLRFIRIVRLARVFRVLKMGKQYGGTEVLTDVFKSSLPALIPPFFMLFLGIVFFSSLMYICEQGEYDPSEGHFYVDDVHGRRVQSTMVSIPECLWWGIVTTTTVGYGDSYPHTAFGKIVASMTMIFGIIFSAMPIATIGSAFTEKWDEMRIRMNAAKDFRKNEQTNKTCNWGPNQLHFFSMMFAPRACTTVAEFLGDTQEAQEAMRTLDSSEEPKNFISRRLSHELMTNRDRIEQGVLPPAQWNLAYKLYHIMRAESSKSENNIENYTLDFITELYHVLGFGQLDEQTDAMLGFRSKAGLAILFGNGAREKEIKSDSDLGIFGIHRATNRAAYFIGNQAKTTATYENNGKIAGELLAMAQNLYSNFSSHGSNNPKTVFLVTYSGYHVKFYAAEFPIEYLDAISLGKRPHTEVRIRHFPPKLSIHYNHSTIQGSFDFLTPSHREEAVQTLIRMKRMVVEACTAGRARRGSLYNASPNVDEPDEPTRRPSGLMSALKSFPGFSFRRPSDRRASYASDKKSADDRAPDGERRDSLARGGTSAHAAATFARVHRSDSVSSRRSTGHAPPRDSTLPRPHRRSLRPSLSSSVRDTSGPLQEPQPQVTGV